MSAPEITPETLRAIADEAERIDKYIDMGAVLGLHRWAANLEREQAEVKRIDELVTIFFRAAYQATGADTVMSTADVARGIRAVLDAERDLITDPIEAADYQAQALGITQEKCATEARADGYGDPGADPADEWDQQDSPAGTIPTLCAQSDPTVGYPCTRLHGHTGQHQAKLEGTILGTWGGAA